MYCNLGRHVNVGTLPHNARMSKVAMRPLQKEAFLKPLFASLKLCEANSADVSELDVF